MATYKVSEDGSRIFAVTETDEQELPDLLSLKQLYEKSEADREDLKNEAEKYRKGNSELRKQYEGVMTALGPNKIEDAVAALASVTQLSDKHQLDLQKATASFNEQRSKELAAIEQAKNEEIKKAREEAEDYRKKYSHTLHFNRVVNSQVLSKTRYADSVGRSDAYEKFKSHFREDGTYVNHLGVPIMSTKRIGEPADFDEAIKVIIDSRDDAEVIWARPEAKGSGGYSASGSYHGGKKTPSEKIGDAIKKQGWA
jgi:hypothetical protein